MRQLKITDIRRSDCPFVHRLEEDDYHCNAVCINKLGYDLIGEDSDDFALRLAEVNGINFDDIVISSPVNPSLPNYIPNVPNGSDKLFRGYNPEFVAVGLKDVVSPKELRVVKDVHKMLGVPKKTKVILLGFGKDALIERVWPCEDRSRILREITALDIYAVIPPNYSVWDDQPHAERLINEKRSLIAYRDLIELGAPAIPHIYWYGYKDLDAWVEFLNNNQLIKTVSIDMQTLGRESDWRRALLELRYFVAKLPTDINFVIVGPSTTSRIQQISNIIPNITIINGVAAQCAVRRRILGDSLSKTLVLDADKTTIMRNNDLVMNNVVESAIQECTQEHIPDKAIDNYGFRILKKAEECIR